MAARLTVEALQTDLGVKPDGDFGRISTDALFARFTNTGAPAVTSAEIAALAKKWNLPVGHIEGVRKIESPRGAFDRDARPSILFERHKFRDNCAPKGRFNASHPALSGGAFGKGGYGPFKAQYAKLASACALDPHAAFAACSWGAFQVLGEHAEDLGYSSPYAMALALTKSEGAHLDCFRRFVESRKLVDEFKACRPGDPKSCIPFVQRYNGAEFRTFDYHTKLANAI